MRPSRLLLALALTVAGWIPGIGASGRSAFAATLQAMAPSTEPSIAEIGDLPLERGGTIRGCRLEYRTFGTLNGDRSNAVLWPTWFSGRTENLIDQVGPDAVVDPSTYFVILVGALGDGLSSSPSNSPAQANEAFPEYTVRDMVEAERRLVTNVLHLTRLHAVIGISMGGMQAFQWAVSHPDMLDRVVAIVGSPKLSPYDRLLWTTELSVIEGRLAAHCDASAQRELMGEVGAIHELALSTPDHVNSTVQGGGFETWLADRRRGYVEGQNPYDWASQLRAMLAHDVTAGDGGSIEAAARRAAVPLLAVVATRDHMVNPDSARAFIAAAPHGRALELSGDCGHLANGCEGDRMRPVVRQFLAGD